MNAQKLRSKPWLLRASLFLSIASSAAMITIWLIPISSGLLRLAWFVAWAGLVAGLTGMVWKKRVLRLVPSTLLVLALLPLLFPGRPLDRDLLRGDYLDQLTALEGTIYVWGGEKSHGIDCSGLPRKALRAALLHQGVSRMNGSGIRGFLGHWWFDASAKALGQGYRDYTVSLPNNGTVHTLDTTGMLPGDLTVSSDGRHVMVFLGGERWIHADPGAGKVVIEHATVSTNPWFDAHVTTHRWNELSEEL